MTIEEYLAELERRIPRTRRGRFLVEAEEHLRDAARANERRGLDPESAERTAVESFGDVSLVARRLASEAAVWETRIAAALALGATFLFVFPLYVVPENTLPPATWIEKPRDILALQVIAVALWISAGVLATASTFLAWTGWIRFAAPVLGLALLAMAASILASAVLVTRWFTASEVPVAWPLLAAPLAVACLLACAEAAGWAHSRRSRLLQD